ncbi:hypothetical protein Emtol_1589 [Emticicia oligotrophica DSM 17448]|uniref:Uncharacterized protein n=1 Tax=Emticicia oligotrophica (strain DSM 17448 / CIP 109782 / MTCC 6937 / GPTSA100-15) TaxID=929562 RepID=A0ABN4AKD6_EMTOG|nr:hypothetical protein Emtol_1589 [Emticicia oligotrophica DSM 17448]
MTNESNLNFLKYRINVRAKLFKTQEIRIIRKTLLSKYSKIYNLSDLIAQIHTPIMSRGIEKAINNA